MIIVDNLEVFRKIPKTELDNTWIYLKFIDEYKLRQSALIKMLFVSKDNTKVIFEGNYNANNHDLAYQFSNFFSENHCILINIKNYDYFIVEKSGTYVTRFTDEFEINTDVYDVNRKEWLCL